MPYTTIPTVVTGDIIPASHGNLLKANLDYHQGLLDGTGGAVTVTVPSTLRIANDAQWSLGLSVSNPLLNFDANDFMYFDRSGNQLVLQVGASNFPLILASTGKLTGAGFYSSGEVSVTNANSTTVSHGLPARPRSVLGFASTSTGSEDAKTIPFGGGWNTNDTIRVTSVTSTQITVRNDDGGTRFLHIYARL